MGVCERGGFIFFFMYSLSLSLSISLLRYRNVDFALYARAIDRKKSDDALLFIHFFPYFFDRRTAFCQFVVHNQEKKAEERARARYAGGRVTIHSHYLNLSLLLLLHF